METAQAYSDVHMVSNILFLMNCTFLMGNSGGIWSIGEALFGTQISFCFVLVMGDLGSRLESSVSFAFSSYSYHRRPKLKIRGVRDSLCI